MKVLSDTLEINQIVDHVGLMERLKLSMIEIVSKLMEKKLLYSQSLIPLDVALSYHVSLWDVTEDKSELLGVGLIELVSLPEEILVIKLHVILTLWKNVPITLVELEKKTVVMSNKLILLVVKLVVLETVLTILVTKTKLQPVIHYHQLKLLNKIWLKTDL